MSRVGFVDATLVPFRPGWKITIIEKLGISPSRDVDGEANLDPPLF